MTPIDDRPSPIPIADLRSGAASLLPYLEALCDRIDRWDPHVGAFLPEPDRRARILASGRALLEADPHPNTRPPLWGAPVGVKDLFRIAGFPLQAGSTLPESEFAGPQSEAVSRLLNAGAVVMGRTVTTEFAYFEPGPTRNPWHLEHTPGGSSSGSAAAVAAGFCPLAIGSQTVGSVIRPAAFCGVVGFKPTFGRIPLNGVVPFSVSFDHAGIFSRDLLTARAAASVLCDGWRELQPGSARPVLGVPEGPYLDQMGGELGQAGLDAFRATLRKLEEAGFAVLPVPVLEDLAEVTERHQSLMAYEFAEVQRTWFATYEERYRERTAWLIRKGQGITAEAAEAGRLSRARLREEVNRWMDAAGVDMLVCPPALGTALQGLSYTGDPRMNLPWTHSGMPAATLPAGLSGGLPLGLQCVGRANADEELLAACTSLEGVLAS
jgi:Asp-tRNA(Asn)/Glu-tRNA(Gln) amidotransferase A subunit family amidase